MESSVLRVGKISDEIFIYMYGKDKESIKKKKSKRKRDFLGGAVVRNLPGNAGDMVWEDPT